MMTRSPQYFANYRLFLHELTKPIQRPIPITRAARMKAVTRGAQARLGRIRANQVFDRIIKGKETS